ncbi:hypothetical protein [Hymenobacter negativus]|uniref:Uncharacterized protein n=1 Tax=Hymenobacter negativus TaxID=2795026 RepID=A0ABS3QPM4_9BACT|nr:hypothetical protein [Hymenobacter negativus]MBO2013072.1 hypothetical protein [Hymenobacter negativus]
MNTAKLGLGPDEFAAALRQCPLLFASNWAAAGSNHLQQTSLPGAVRLSSQRLKPASVFYYLHLSQYLAPGGRPSSKLLP